MSESEWVWHISCVYNTPQELRELEHLLELCQGATDENTEKHLQREISITRAKREIAEAKRVRSL